jgi:CDGSH-type Zn-finger protein
LVVRLRALEVTADGSHKGTGFTPVEYKPAAAEEAWFCACKRSGKKPMCDGSHKRL